MATHFALKSLYTLETLLVAFEICISVPQADQHKLSGWTVTGELRGRASWSPDKAFAGFINTWERQRSGFKNWAQELGRSDNLEQGMFGINISGMNSSPHLPAQISLQTQYTSHFILRYIFTQSQHSDFFPSRYSLQHVHHSECKKYLNQIYILQTLQMYKICF